MSHTLHSLRKFEPFHKTERNNDQSAITDFDYAIKEEEISVCVEDVIETQETDDAYCVDFEEILVTTGPTENSSAKDVPSLSTNTPSIPVNDTASDQQTTRSIVPSTETRFIQGTDSSDPMSSSELEDVVTELKYTISGEDAEYPTLVVNDRQLNDVGDEAIGLLEKSNIPPTMFVRSDTLCRIIETENKGPVIQTLTSNILSAMLAKTCDTVHVTEKGLKNVFPPPRIISYILTQGLRSFPALEGITQSPSIRPDGTISQTPGYDSETGLFYHRSKDSKAINISENPTRGQVQAALDLIEELLCDFPFDCQASKANMMAMLVTTVARPAIEGHIPLFLLDAPTAGSGKSKLAGIAAIISTGKDPRFTTAPTKDEEWDKKISALLSGCSSLIVLDNVNHTLKNESLAALLTATELEVRPFGQNTKTATYPNRATWVVTGNNILLGGDIPRRCTWISIDPKMAKPHEREGFLHPDLEQWVKDNRDRLLGALLTLCRSWYADECPEYPTPVFGSFEKWANVVGSILAHVGVSGFLENPDRLGEQSDPETGEWEAFLETWLKVYGNKPIMVKNLVEDITNGNDITNVVPESVSEVMCGNGDKRSKIGYLFKARHKKRYGTRNLRLDKMPPNSKGAFWRVLAD